MAEKELITLALETGIGSGSVSVLSGKSVLISEEGGTHRANEILTTINSAMRRTGLSPSDVNRLAVSVGPGSYTGLRIGIATALGLSRSRKVKICGVPVLAALAATTAANKKGAAISIGRDRAAIQIFDNSDQLLNERAAYVVNDDEITRLIEGAPETEFVVLGKQFENWIERLGIGRSANVNVTNSHLAELVGCYSLENECVGLDPIYL